MRDTAKRAFVATVVAGSVVVLALALWKLKILLALIFLAFIIAAAMRPAVDAMGRRRIPRGVAVLLLYAAFAGAIGLALWLVVPRAVHQVDSALGPGGASKRAHPGGEALGAASKHDILIAIRNRLNDLPSAGKLVRPAAEVGFKAFEVLVGVFFVFAAAAYWIFERERAIDLVTSLIATPETKARPGHVAPDRPQARRVRPRPVAADPRSSPWCSRSLLGDRAPVLAARRQLRGPRRDRPGDRTADRRRRSRSASA